MYGTLLVYKQIFMKKYTLILAACLISSMAFAQILPTVSGEVDANGEVDASIVLNSAPTMSGEIDIALPFDPLEVENEVTGEFPPYSLNSATYVETGAGSVIAFMLMALLGTALYSYKVRTQNN